MTSPGYRVRLSALPDPESERRVDFADLTGGLNLYEPEYHMDSRETPEIKNLFWQDGALVCRDGQSWLMRRANGQGHACFEGLFHERAFLHVGSCLYAATLSAEPDSLTLSAEEGQTLLTLDVPGLREVTGVSVNGAPLPAADFQAQEAEGTVTLSQPLRLNDSVSVSYTACALTQVCDLSELYAAYEPHGGVFFRYGEHLYYKARGVYVRITYTDEGAFTAEDMASPACAYTPVTVINADAATGSGDLYQPENRLSGRKCAWYNAGVQEVFETQTTASETVAYTAKTANVVEVLGVTLAGKMLTDGFDYVATVIDGTATITLREEPTRGKELVFQLSVATVHYYLPVKSEDVSLVSFEAVMSAGAERTALNGLPADSPDFPTEDPDEWQEAWDEYDFVFWPETGHVLLKNPAYVSVPAENNTVHITWSQDNPDAWSSVMDCDLVAVFGVNRGLCIVFGGCPAQPNAYFWNGNNIAMDAGYFPMEHYNFAGDASEAITGFGCQQSMLVIFKTGCVGRAAFGLTQVDGRERITMDYTPINSAVGCDLPGSIRLIDNNLAFCNTLQGVFRVADTTPAQENNITCISRKINGTPQRSGLLDAVKDCTSVVTLDDGSRYWLCAGGCVYLWDYALSRPNNPSWFYFDAMDPVGFIQHGSSLWHLNASGQLTVMERTFSDYGQAIDKVFALPAQSFGSYDRLKDVTRLILVLRSDTSSSVRVTYRSDWETRDDRTDVCAMSWRLCPRNLKYRYLGVPGFAAVTLRTPGCRHVRHFAVRLQNQDVAADMTLLSAQLYFKYSGRDR